MEENEANVTSNPRHSKKKKKSKSIPHEHGTETLPLKLEHECQSCPSCAQCSASNFIGELL